MSSPVRMKLPLGTRSSSCIANLEYDPVTWDLYVTFVRHMDEYVYYEVPPQVALSFAMDPSGAFFNSQIKDQYDYAEI